MSLFSNKSKAKYLKIMAYGPGGSGKTTFGTTLPWPRYWIDSEHSGDHIRDPKDPVLYTTSFRELQEAVAEIRATNEVKSLIIDPYTVFWERLIDQIESQSPKGLTFQSWAKIKKPDNRLMTDLLNLPCHVLITLHERDEYMMVRSEDHGRLEPVKVGVRPDAEKKVLYRPDLMLRFAVEDGRHVAYIQKIRIRRELAERTGLRVGAKIENPSWADFAMMAEEYASGIVQAHYTDDRETQDKDERVFEELAHEAEEAQKRKLIGYIQRGERKCRELGIYGWRDDLETDATRRAMLGSTELDKLTADSLNFYLQGLKKTVERHHATQEVSNA
jgi:hypothetical protein